MKYQNKLKNAARALAKETAERLGLTTDELLTLHAWASTEANGCPSFCAWCLVLESTPGSPPPFEDELAMKIDDPRSIDPRFSLVYDLITAFLIHTPAEFWTRNRIEHALQVCGVCGKPVRPTPSGYVCEDGHGGEEEVRVIEDLQQISEEMFGSPPPKQLVKFGERPTIKWNEGQSKAFHAIFDWYRSNTKPIYRLFGYAGTGKTSMIQEIAWTIQNGERGIPKGEVLFAAYTGKAAAVMLSKGCAGAQTLHSLIYKAKIDPVTGQVTGFIRNKESPLRYAKLLICDEVSMVNAELAMDLLKFGVPILVVGDPGQLDPIEGEGFFTRGRPDTLLTKVERVALDNPLIWIATRIRKGLVLKPGRYGDSRVYAPNTEIRDKHIMKADQIICGRNKTRMSLNRRYRMLSGHYDQDTQFPVRGDRLMCLKNNKITGVLNGTQWHCSEPEIRPIMKLKDIKNPLRGFEPTNLDGLHFRVRALDLFDSEGNPLIINTVCSAHHFDTNLPEPPWRDIAGTDAYTFGYAATAHKFQGSQAEHTLVIDESVFFGDQEWKHRYTTATRASVSMDMFLAEAA